MANSNPSDVPASDGAETLKKFGYEQTLKRKLGYWDLLIYGLVFMVPIAPFTIFGTVFNVSAGQPALAYVVGLVAMLLTASAYAVFSQRFPVSGSAYSYVGRGIARPVGFVAGWMVLLDYLLIPSLLYLLTGIALNLLLPLVPVWVWIIAFIVINTAINFFGIEVTARANRIFLAFEMLVLVIFLVFAVITLARGGGNGFSWNAFFDPNHFSVAAIFGAVSVAALSFLGFDGISTLAEENRGSTKQLARATVYSLLVVALLFVLQAWFAAMLVPDPDSIIKNGDPDSVAFYNAAQVAGGSFLFILTTGSALIAVGFANAIVAQAATSRVLFAMARDRQLPAFLSKVDAKNGTPRNAILLTAVLTLIIGIGFSLYSDGVAVLSTLVNFGALTTFSLLNLAVIWYFGIKGRSRRWFVHYVVPVLAIVILVTVLINARALAQLIGVVWLVIGVVIAVLVAKRGTLRDPLAGAEGSASDLDAPAAASQ